MKYPLILLFFRIYIHNWRLFISEVLKLYQTFADCMSDKCTYFRSLGCQHTRCNCKLWNAPWIFYTRFLWSSHIIQNKFLMCSPNFHKLCIWLKHTHNFQILFVFETLYLHQTFTNCVLSDKKSTFVDFDLIAKN